MNIGKTNHAKKAQRHSAVAMASFYNIIAGLHEANRHHELELDDAKTQRDQLREQIAVQVQRSVDANTAREQNLRVLDRVAALID